MSKNSSATVGGFPALCKLANMSEQDLAQIEYPEDVVVPDRIYLEAYMNPLGTASYDLANNLIITGPRQHFACSVLNRALLEGFARSILQGVSVENLPFYDFHR